MVISNRIRRAARATALAAATGAALSGALLALALPACDNNDGSITDSGPPPAPCFDFRDYLHIAGHVNTDGNARGAFIAGSYGYVADGDRGLVVIDLSDPALPFVAGSVDVGGEAGDVAVDGDVACVTAGAAGLAVVDVSNPASPSVVTTVNTPGVALRLVVVPGARRLAYVADDVIGLMIFDVTDPEGPVGLGVENTPGRPRDVAVVGDVAYVADASLGVRIVSVADPAAPWLIRTVPSPGQAEGIAATDDYVYLADGGAGLRVIAVSDIDTAKVVGVLDTPGSALDVAVRGSTAFVADRFSGLRVVNVSRPDAPVLESVSESSGVTSGVAIAGDLVLAADGDLGVRVISVASVDEPPRRTGSPGVGNAVDVAAADSGIVYVADADRGLVVLEMQAGIALEVGGVDVGGTPVQVRALDQHAYVAIGSGGIMEVDVTDPANPTVLGTIPSSIGAIGFAIMDSVVCSVRGIGSFNVFDIRLQFPPQSLTISGSNYFSAVDAADGVAYLSARNGRMYVVDISDLTNLRLIHLAATTGRAQGIAVRDGYLFIASDQGGPVPGETFSWAPGVELYDLTNPRQPAFAGLIEMSGAAARVHFEGDVMYVAAGEDGVELFDVSDPLLARRLGTFSTRAKVEAVVVSGDWLVVAGGTDGIFTLPAQCAR